MTAIWAKAGGAWSLVSPAGFPDEAALHGLVEEAPQLMPLAGAPGLVVVGREVRLGSGYADLIAVEPSGRLAVIEVKLAVSPEARRAVVAQVLAYAAFLRGLSLTSLESAVLGVHLAKRGFASVADAARSVDQTGAFDEASFNGGLESCLASGAFRLVLVLDDAPAELVRLVGYLEAIAPGLVIDLIIVSAYTVAGTTVMVPQRVEPEREAGASRTAGTSGPAKVAAFYAADGGAEFRKAAQALPEAKRAVLTPIIDWAVALEQDGLARLYSYHGGTRFTLLPRLIGEDAGPITIWDSGLIYAYRSVLERRSPTTLAALDERLAKPIGQGTVLQPADAGVLALLRQAYEEAAGR